MHNIPVGYIEKMRMLKSELLLGNHENASVEDLSRIAMKSNSTLYKACSITEDNPPPFDLEWLVPFMNAKKNYNILKHLCLMCGFLPPAKIPSYKKEIKDKNKMTIEYQKICNEAVTNLMEFINDPTENKYDDLRKSLEQVIKKSLTANNYCRNHIGDQGELF